MKEFKTYIFFGGSFESHKSKIFIFISKVECCIVPFISKNIVSLLL